MKARNLYLATAICAGSLAIGNVANAQDVFVDDAVTVPDFTSQFGAITGLLKLAPVLTSHS